MFKIEPTDFSHSTIQNQEKKNNKSVLKTVTTPIYVYIIRFDNANLLSNIIY